MEGRANPPPVCRSANRTAQIAYRVAGPAIRPLPRYRNNNFSGSELNGEYIKQGAKKSGAAYEILHHSVELHNISLPPFAKTRHYGWLDLRKNARCDV